MRLFIENYMGWIGLAVGIIAAVIAIWQLALQAKEMKLGNRINSLESLATMLRNSVADKQELLMMNKRNIQELEALEELSEELQEKLAYHQAEKHDRNCEIKSLYNGLLSVNVERCKLMDGIEKKLDENVSKAITDMQEMFEKRKAKELEVQKQAAACVDAGKE